MTTENDTQATEPALPQEIAAPVPRLVIVVEAEPKDAVELLRAVGAGAGKGKRRGPKLSAELAGVIRQRLAAGEAKQALAEEYGVTVMTIENIASGRSYPEAAMP